MVARKSYEGTEVSVSKSQEELRALLRKHEAAQFSFGEGRDWVGIEFIHNDQLVRLRCPLRVPTDADLKERNRKVGRSKEENAEALLNRDAMRVWRVLVWSVKARLVAVEEGLETFEQAFLSHLVDPSSDKTIWQQVREPIEEGAFQLGGQGLRALGPGR